MTVYTGQTRTMLGQLCAALWDSQSQLVVIQQCLRPLLHSGACWFNTEEFVMRSYCTVTKFNHIYFSYKKCENFRKSFIFWLLLYLEIISVISSPIAPVLLNLKKSMIFIIFVQCTSAISSYFNQEGDFLSKATQHCPLLFVASSWKIIMFG
jgi:hypothetical protein